MQPISRARMGRCRYRPRVRLARATDLGGSRAMLVGIGVAFAAFLVYWLSDRMFDAGRGDLFYLADSFLHGHPWIDVKLGPNDIIAFGGHLYVPFAPFPAIVLMPLVAVIGPVTADQWEPGIDAGLRRDRGAARLVGLGPDRGCPAPRPPRDGGAARLLHAGVVDHDPRRRVAHGAPDRDDPDPVPAGRDVRATAARADGPAGRRWRSSPGRPWRSPRRRWRCGCCRRPGRIGPARAPHLAGSTAVARVGTAGARGRTRGAVLLLVQRRPLR